VNSSNSLPNGNWELALDRILPTYGHRNWIVIADSAYPAHSNPGITTIATGADHLQVLSEVLDRLSSCEHIRAHVYTDLELKFISEEDAAGVCRYRLALDRLLAAHDTRALEHEQIISRLDQAATLFNILILKTTLRLPYTSVFLNLDCGYWSTDAEARLRARLQAPDLNSASTDVGA